MRRGVRAALVASISAAGVGPAGAAAPTPVTNSVWSRAAPARPGFDTPDGSGAFHA
jgi:hypothetical protein